MKKLLYLAATSFVLTACTGHMLGLPEAQLVTEIRVEDREGDRSSAISQKAIIAALYEAMTNHNGYGRESVSDQPDVKDYRQFSLVYRGGEQTMFVYEKAGKTYLEHPYHGIWELEGISYDYLNTLLNAAVTD